MVPRGGSLPAQHREGPARIPGSNKIFPAVWASSSRVLINLSSSAQFFFPARSCWQMAIRRGSPSRSCGTAGASVVRKPIPTPRGRFSFQLGARNSLAFADARTSPASDDFGASPFLAPGMGAPRTNLMVAARSGRVQPCELEADIIRRRNSGGEGSQASTGTPRVNAFGRVDLSGCELRASLPGYRSESIQLRHSSVFDNPNVGVIILHPLAKGQGISVSATSLAAPKQAKKAYEKALKELRKKDAILWFAAVKAIEQLEKAVAEYPEYAKAWSLLGRTRLSINDKEGAREAFDKATKADPKYLGPYEALLRMELAEKR